MNKVRIQVFLVLKINTREAVCPAVLYLYNAHEDTELEIAITVTFDVQDVMEEIAMIAVEMLNGDDIMHIFNDDVLEEAEHYAYYRVLASYNEYKIDEMEWIADQKYNEMKEAR